MGLPAWSEAHSQTLHRGIGATEECIEQASLDAFLLPDNDPFEPHTLLWFRLSLISGSIDNLAATEVSNVLHEIDDGLSEVLLKLSPPNDFPRLQGQVAGGHFEKDSL